MEASGSSPIPTPETPSRNIYRDDSFLILGRELPRTLKFFVVGPQHQHHGCSRMRRARRAFEEARSTTTGRTCA